MWQPSELQFNETCHPRKPSPQDGIRIYADIWTHQRSTTETQRFKHKQYFTRKRKKRAEVTLRFCDTQSV